MVIFPVIPLPGLIFGVIVLLAIAAGILFSLYFAVVTSMNEWREREEKAYSRKEEKTFLIEILLMIVAVGTAISGFRFANGTVGTIGIILWMLTAIVISYTGTPFRLLIMPDGAPEGSGCAYMLYMPLMLCCATMKLLLMMFFSWIFVLKNILKNSSKPFQLLTIILIIGFVLAIIFGIPRSGMMYKSKEPNPISISLEEPTDVPMPN